MIFLKRRALMTRFSFNYKTASGIGSLVLEKCSETFFKQFKLLGNSVQQETPSQEFPQEIKSVGEYNSDTGKYDVDVKITGKNLFDISKLKVGLVQGDGSINENSNIYRTIILDIKKSGKYLFFFKSNNDYNRLYFTTMYSNGKLTKPYLSVFAEKNTFIVLEKGINILSFKARKNDTDVQFVCDSDIMISYDINNVDYEPCKEPQTIKLSLDQPLRGIGEHKDEVTKDGIVRRIKQIVWNGSENWNLSNSNLVQTNKFYLSKVNDAYSAYRKISSLVDALPFVADENSDELGQRFYLGNPMINLDKQKIPDVDTLKQWLSENPMTVQYALAEPIIEPLAEESKKALESLYTNEGTTVIAVDGGEVEAGIEVEYAVKE